METALASLEFELTWKSRHATHSEQYFFPKVNFWRDILPPQLDGHTEELLEKGRLDIPLAEGQLTGAYNQTRLYQVPKSRLKQRVKQRRFLVGRFYPCGMMPEIGFPSEDLRPLRIVGETEDAFRIDTNHPLSACPLALNVRLVEVLTERHMRGGSSNDIAYVITENGPGFQAEHPDAPTDFSTGNPFSRQDTSADRDFYDHPRLVDHVDREAGSRIASLYDRILKPGMRVLDLMAAWNSHIHLDRAAIHVTGLGLNATEMAENSLLTDSVIHDLNRDPQLPFPDRSFDACVCALSVEYLARPFAVFREAGRVLKPGAPFIVTFSDRWFEPKVIQLWTELHAFERMGLVLHYFREAGCFKDLHTDSIRGYPRPEKDRHIHERQLSDPVFAVSGVKL